MTISHEAALAPVDSQELARRHLWMHFTPLGRLADQGIPVIVRGQGCRVWDERGREYLDGLSALFCVNAGHGRTELLEPALRQADELGFFPVWGYAHPRAIELAARIAELAPGDLNRVFFTSGGSEAVETALKLARQYHKLTGHPNKTKVIARATAYHGTSLGALSLTGVTNLREPFEPLTPGGCHVPNTNTYRLPPGVPVESLAEAVRERILFEGPDTVAAVILEPVQNAGGCFVPPDGYFARVREICDELDVLLISDEVICSWGRLGTNFGAERYGYWPDIITTAKGLTSGYAALGATIVADRVAGPFLEGGNTFMHGITFAGHPIACAIALANLDVFEEERLLENVRRHEGAFRDMLESLQEIPIVGEVRGAGYFQAFELVKDQGTKESFGREEANVLLRQVLAPAFAREGLICRVDDRGDPIVQLAPPLIAGPAEFEEMHAVLVSALTEATNAVDAGLGA